MIAQGTDAKNVTPEQIAQVAQDVELFCKANHVTRAAVAKAIGFSAGVLSEFVKGAYAGNAGQVAIDLDDWLVEEEARRSSAQKTTFVWTNVAQQIRAVAQYCLDKKKVGLIYGPETSGIGKTTSLQAIAQDLGPRRAALIMIDKSDANPSALLKKILGGISSDQAGSNAQRKDRIVELLRGRSHILLIDQIHNLRYAKEDRPLYYLMDIFEAAGTAQLWSGTSDMVSYLQRQRAKNLDEPLAQIRRRIFPCVDLMEVCGDGNGGTPLYTIDQVREMFSKFQLKLTTAGARWICALARVPGSGALGTAYNIVEYATMLGQMRHLPSLDVPLLKEALRCSLSVQRADALIEETTSKLGTVDQSFAAAG